MNLKPCPDCGRDVSKDAAACPGCGRKIRQEQGALWALLVVTIIIMAIGLIFVVDMLQK